MRTVLSGQPCAAADVSADAASESDNRTHIDKWDAEALVIQNNTRGRLALIDAILYCGGNLARV
jgi:hypothetical protein